MDPRGVADQRTAGALSITTSNYYLRDIKAFFRWLVKDRRTAENPLSHLVAGDNDGLSRYVAHLEEENTYLREQNTVKDGQIGALLERDRETNLLINGLQRLLGPLLGAPERERDYPAGGR